MCPCGLLSHHMILVRSLRKIWVSKHGKSKKMTHILVIMSTIYLWSPNGQISIFVHVSWFICTFYSWKTSSILLSRRGGKNIVIFSKVFYPSFPVFYPPFHKNWYFDFLWWNWPHRRFFSTFTPENENMGWGVKNF